ncbi:hypothetical protein ASPFODRAFT_203910 [Aspergillus luchuensis CBS 106.47]|uniref:Uncharacterized protein n=1 Tax=Aspergillus luchuensis (strain CBS 106.47) TaxID=1137211 RepID=A0A1M3TXH2_ASPLC|nr:hypothetical protein ASPFODRAFT_203910 [Aspergillus luchuensis CBS 106.47]
MGRRSIPPRPSVPSFSLSAGSCFASGKSRLLVIPSEVAVSNPLGLGGHVTCARQSREILEYNYDFF